MKGVCSGFHLSGEEHTRHESCFSGDESAVAELGVVACKADSFKCHIVFS